MHPNLAYHLSKEFNAPISLIETVLGGDINDCFRFRVDDADYFIKVNNAHAYANIFTAEQDGLFALSDHNQRIPKVLKTNQFEEWTYLILEYLKPKPPTEKDWIEFGQSLADLHLTEQAYFGYSSDNYLATLIQENSQKDGWSEFYRQQRIWPLAKKIDKKYSMDSTFMNLADNFCSSVEEIFPNETPSLVHGDLWSGNIHCSDEGFYLIDPAVYFGHREMDIGMSLLFGGFNPTYLEAYQEIFPLEQDWKDRIKYAQLYPLMVHLYLFGKSYLGAVTNILKE